MVGTRCYHAPERIVAVGFAGPADLLGLGLSLLEAGLGDYPFRDSLHHNYIALLEHIVACPCPVDQLPAADAVAWGAGGRGFSEGFRGVLCGCLGKQARDRPTAARLLADPFVAAVDRGTARVRIACALAY